MWCTSAVCLGLKPLEVSPRSFQDQRDVNSRTANSSCPPWKYDKYDNSSCVCGDSVHDVVVCRDDQSTVSLLTCHCMSQSDSTDDLLVGNCPYLCTNDFYTEIPEHTDPSELCNRDINQNRGGQMCGRCVENFSPSPYSYSFECSNCTDHESNWIKYLAVAYLPLTVFFFAVIVFRFNAMSASMNSFILVCQVLSCPAVMSIMSVYIRYNGKDPEMIILEVLTAIFGVWNLDFFRIMYEPFCLHPSASILQIMSLDYAIAVYPFILVCLTYFLIKCYDGFQSVQLICKPAAWFFTQIFRRWSPANSLIEAFGTFFLLSYIKVINTSFDILMPVQLHNVSGQVVGLYVYYNGSLEYLGSDHLPYAILAIFMFVAFNLVPLLLLFLYPCRCFQSCLNCCRLNSQVLRTFMDAFQGCYKFEPYDCRYWAASYLFLRIAVLVIFFFTQSGYFVLITGISLVPVTALLALLRPYREDRYNVSDELMLLSVIILCFSAVGFSLSAFDRRYQTFVSVTFGMGMLYPPTYVMILAVKRIIYSDLVATLKNFLLRLISRCRNKEELERDDEDVEDRLLQDFDESSESDDSRLHSNEQPHYNSLLDYTRDE